MLIIWWLLLLFDDFVAWNNLTLWLCHLPPPSSQLVSLPAEFVVQHKLMHFSAAFFFLCSTMALPQMVRPVSGMDEGGQHSQWYGWRRSVRSVVWMKVVTQVSGMDEGGHSGQRYGWRWSVRSVVWIKVVSPVGGMDEGGQWYGWRWSVRSVVWMKAVSPVGGMDEGGHLLWVFHLAAQPFLQHHSVGQNRRTCSGHWFCLEYVPAIPSRHRVGAGSCVQC